LKLRKIKINHNFEPCKVDDGDEVYPNGIFIFNITKMYEYINHNPLIFNIDTYLLDEYHSQFTVLNESHIINVDINKPGIMAEISPGWYNLIDGNHRCEKAVRLGKKSFDVYRFEMESHLQFLTTKQGYNAYVEYWNSKSKP